MGTIYLGYPTPPTRTAGTIYLGYPTPPTRTAGTIYLTPKKTGIAAYREKKTIGGRIVKALTSLKTTAVLGTILGALTGGAALAAGRTVAGRVVATTVAKKVATRTVGKTILAGAGKVGLTAVKAVARKPVLAIVGAGVLVSGAAPTIVKGLFKTGKVAGQVITGEKALTSETIMDLAKGAGIVAGLGVAGVGVGYIAKKFLEKKEAAAPTILQETGGLVAQQPVVAEAPITGTPPITPETVSLEEPTVKAAVKEPYKPRREKITQRVNVNVDARQSAHRITQKYINAVPQIS